MGKKTRRNLPILENSAGDGSNKAPEKQEEACFQAIQTMYYGDGTFPIQEHWGAREREYDERKKSINDG